MCKEWSWWDVPLNIRDKTSFELQKLQHRHRFRFLLEVVIMGFIYVAVAVLSLLCGGQSAPANGCDSLTRQIEIQGREQVRHFFFCLTFLLHALSPPQNCLMWPLSSCTAEGETVFQLLGKWIILAESLNVPGSRLLTEALVDSSWVKVTAANESNSVNFFQKQKR